MGRAAAQMHMFEEGAASGKNLSRGLNEMKGIARRLERLAAIGMKSGAGKVEQMKSILKNDMKKVLENLEKIKDKIKSSKFLQRAKEGEKNVKTAKKLENKSSMFKKIMPGGKALTLAGVLGGAYLYHEASDTYEEAKLDCQETCQGFNDRNISKLKYDQILNLIYCRDKEDIKKPCSSFNGGGPKKGKIELNKCPSECIDISKQEESHINSMLYGSCSLTDKNMRCEYPSYINHNKVSNKFGLSPLGKGANKDTPDNKFKDPWHGYAAVRAAAVTEIGMASAGVGAGVGAATQLGNALNNVPGGAVGVSGVAGAAIANAFIPDSFPGHCLHNLFKNYTNEDPNIYSLGFGGSELSDENDYKYIQLCKKTGSNNINDLAPENGEVKKCSLETGEVSKDGSGTSSDTHGSCIAWKKSENGKCLPTMHNLSFSTKKEEISDTIKEYTGLGSGEGECLSINEESKCNNHQYCYWTNDNSNNDPGLDNFYFCIHDDNLIDVHNGILDNISITDSKKDNLFIKSTRAGDVNSEIDKDSRPQVKSLNNYSGGENINNKKEIDVGDICNNYCGNYLCHEPYISMPLMPGVTSALDAIEKAINLFMKIIISSFIGLVIYFLTIKINIDKTLRILFFFIVPFISIFSIFEFIPSVRETFDNDIKYIRDILVNNYLESPFSGEFLIILLPLILIFIIYIVLKFYPSDQTSIGSSDPPSTSY